MWSKLMHKLPGTQAHPGKTKQKLSFNPVHLDTRKSSSLGLVLCILRTLTGEFRRWDFQILHLNKVQNQLAQWVVLCCKPGKCGSQWWLSMIGRTSWPDIIHPQVLPFGMALLSTVGLRSHPHLLLSVWLDKLTSFITWFTCGEINTSFSVEMIDRTFILPTVLTHKMEPVQTSYGLSDCGIASERTAQSLLCLKQRSLIKILKENLSHRAQKHRLCYKRHPAFET